MSPKAFKLLTDELTKKEIDGEMEKDSPFQLGQHFAQNFKDVMMKKSDSLVMSFPEVQPMGEFNSQIEYQIMYDDGSAEQALTQKQSYGSGGSESVGGHAMQYTPTMQLKIAMKPLPQGEDYRILGEFKSKLLQQFGAQAMAEITPQTEQKLLYYIRKKVLKKNSARPLERGSFASRGVSRKRSLKKSFDIDDLDTHVSLPRRDNDLFRRIWRAHLLQKDRSLVCWHRIVRPDEWLQKKTSSIDSRKTRAQNKLRDQVYNFQKKLIEREGVKRKEHLVTTAYRAMNKVEQIRNFAKELEDANINDCED